MKLYKISISYILLIILFSSFSLVYGQENIAQDLFRIKKNNPMFQAIDSSSGEQVLTTPTHLTVNKLGDLFICDSIGNQVKIDKHGKIVGYKYIFDSYAATSDAQGNIYHLWNYYGDDKVAVFNISGKRERCIPVDPADLNLTSTPAFLIDHNGNPLFFINKNHSSVPAGKANEAYLLDPEFRLQHRWFVQVLLGSGIGNLDHFVLTPCNTVIAWDQANKNMIEMDIKGNLIRKSKLSKISSQDTIGTMAVTSNSRIAIFNNSSRKLLFYDMNGIFLSNLSPDLSRHKNPNIYKMAFASDGSFYLYNSSSGTVEKFSTTGTFVAEIIRKGQCFLSESLKPEYLSISASAVGHDGNLYLCGPKTGVVTKISDTGELLQTINHFSGISNGRTLGIDQNKTIYLATKEVCFAYDKMGNSLGTINFFEKTRETIKDITVSKKGELFIISSENLYQGSIVNSSIQILNANTGLGNAKRIAIDKKGLLHISDGRKIKVFTKKGKLKRIVSLPTEFSTFNIGNNDNYVTVNGYYFKSKIEVFSQSGKLIQAYPFSLKYTAENILQLENGTFAFNYYDSKGVWGLLFYSPRKVFKTKSKKGTILGTLNYEKNSGLITQNKLKIYFEATTPEGKKFGTVLAASEKYRIPNIPIGSTYRLWTSNNYPTSDEFRKTIHHGVLTKERLKLNFVNRPIPSGQVLVSGRITNKYGHGINGVEITNGNKSAVTSLDGCYTIALKPNRTHTLKALRDGYPFVTPSKTLKLTTDDKLYVDFQERK